MIDALGNFYPDWPGQPDPRLRQLAPAARQWPMPQPPVASMTPPTIHAEIIQVPSIDHAIKTPVAAGSSQMFMTADELAIIVKTVNPSADGYSVEIYDRRPPAPPEPVFDPRNYMTRQETYALIDERTKGLQALPPSVPAAAPMPRAETQEGQG